MIDFGPLIPDIFTMALSFITPFMPVFYVLSGAIAATIVISLVRRGI